MREDELERLRGRALKSPVRIRLGIVFGGIELRELVI